MQIGNLAFLGCHRIENIALPSSVTSIGFSAFSSCFSLRRFVIPPSVTSIGHSVFTDCNNLRSIIVEPGNPSYLSKNGVLFNSAGTTLISCPEGKSGNYYVPDSVNHIGESAFLGCRHLTDICIGQGVASIGDSAFVRCQGLESITMPKTVESFGRLTFFGCSRLTKITFLGDAPSLSLSPSNIFEGTSPEFAVYHLSSSKGFTHPDWKTYTLIEIDESMHPAASWLLQHGLPDDMDLNDHSGLLIAYALDLDPHNKSKNNQLTPFFDPFTNTVNLRFRAISPGIRYSVETSWDLENWFSEGVTLTGIDEENALTASIVRTRTRQFMRFQFEYLSDSNALR